MEIQLTPQLEQFVHEQVTSGNYSNVSAVIIAALEMMQKAAQQRAEKLEKLCAAIREGLVGEFVELDMDAIIKEARDERDREAGDAR